MLLTHSGEYVQLLTPRGERVDAPGFDPWVADIDAEELRSLYDDMVISRRLDTEATALQRQGEIGLWPPLLGQEAAQVGSARALRDSDFVFGSYRENAVAYCRGVDLTTMISVWRGNANAGWNPYDINMAAPAIIIGAQSLHAVGYAMGCDFDGSDDISIAYFGDGATSQGDVNEAMVFAASYKAPVIFFCQNNQYAISEPVGVQTTKPIADRAPGFGIPSIRVDGNDVLAVYAATAIAADRARSGNGPTYIEAVTYRMGAHTTSDDPTRYRTESELDEWREKDPLDRVKHYLTSMGALDDDQSAQIDEHADRVARELRAAIRALPEPEPLSFFDTVFAEPNAHLARQRSQHAAYLASFDGGES
ncbi:pyruvate dehydrogenase (acetyl-transferring) E1 component subunit alpha [Paramicrobacterium agarici]|uniref:pyruvate dehydrogenase (acetyl-transferring) E1 component subunit alpha n=1 Tax=Paramicrobacterium agarici TaxID=630514 RepID=UPI00115352E7|nr:pyruvate dehydrogenase (acetyl-transferring) E1 component subunit alpha [Microbacterium agarici]TQO24084.1 pyruvate dehydrogenase E1 component alpha subunit [Microbacterium agarici]